MAQSLLRSLVLLSFLLSMVSCSVSTDESILVKDVEAFNNALSEAKPGTVIKLANGIWKDAELLFEGSGNDSLPIILTAETKGKVFLEGSSNLRIAGSYLEVSGLVFRNGFTTTSEVISFKKDDENLASNSRLTECVIDNYSNPERHEQDYWIGIYGKNNRIDHNHLVGKKNLGVTMAVRLTSEESRENNHRIDHNYFGPRPNLGANGGETLRIGTSHFSLTNSNTIVESNYFDRCNGEHEIISNKSCQNVFKNNTFFECSGTLTMRHGNETWVEGNVFLGNGKPSTGGIRVINEKQTVINNYGYGLKGYRFRGALVIMNGVPNSPINRYFQVDSAVVRDNVFVNSDHVQLCAGSDEERSAVPINSVLEDNVFYHDSKEQIFTVYDDVSGIRFKDNIVSAGVSSNSLPGFESQDLELKKDERGYPIPHNKKGEALIRISPDIATLENTGVAWYSKEDTQVELGAGKEISVEPGYNTLFDAVRSSSPGDVLVLKQNEVYTLTKSLGIDHPLSFKSSGKERSKVLFEKKSVFDIQNGGSLSLDGLVFDGEKAPDYSGNSVIRTSKYSMNENYKLFVNNCVFEDLDVNHSFDVVRIYKNTFADTISISNSIFRNISGNVMALDKETDDKGVYNAEYVILKNNLFTDVGGTVLHLYRGGKDESTFGPFLTIDHCVFNEVGKNKRNKYKSSLSLYGVQEINVTNNIFQDCEPIRIHLVVGEPIVNIDSNNLFRTSDLVISGDQKYRLENLWSMNPEIKEGGLFELSRTSPLVNKGTDGKNLGLVNLLPLDKNTSDEK